MPSASGAPFGPAGYRLVDADTHVNEPPDLWTSRVPADLVDRVPRIERFERGDAWVMEGVADPITFGNNAAAGIPLAERNPWMRWEDIRQGGYIPKVRLEEMDVDLVDAAVLYPTPRISQLVIGTQDPELHLAMVRAYNDWLSEYVEYDPSRLGGIMLVPNRGVEAAVAEIRRVVGRPGIVGCLIGCFPHGDLDISPDDDPVWEAVVAAGVPLHIHVGLTNSLPVDIYAAGRVGKIQVAADLRFLESPVNMLQFISAEVFERFPELHVVMVEVDAGWVPYVKEQLDNRKLRRTAGSALRGGDLPSRVIEDHFSFTYVTDHYAIHNRQAIGVERLMWSSDYPHGGSDWPHSVRTIHADFFGVPNQERDLILAGNALALYKFGL